MNLEYVEELFKAPNDAGGTQSFGGGACTNISNPFDPDDTGWHLMLPKRVVVGEVMSSLLGGFWFFFLVFDEYS